ncbi:MAG: hypothetical protein QM522_08225 [Chitinophagaceae bacterium]|nr:hypothetical protein [Chitinophagaceae bacterium]
MTITTSQATAHFASAASVEDLVPLRLPLEPRLILEQLELVCAENPEMVLALAAVSSVMAMTPPGSETGSRNSDCKHLFPVP